MQFIKHKPAVYAGLVYLFAAVSGCLSTPEHSPASGTHAIKLPETAVSVQKDILLVFTGSDWSDDVPLFMKNVFNSDVKPTIESQFTVHIIDLPRNTDKSDSQALQRNFLLFSEYQVTDVPFIVMQTPEHDTYTAQPLAKNIRTGAELIHTLDMLSKNRDTVLAARKKIEDTSGHEKAIAIHTFLNTVLYPASRRYDSLRQQVPALDPENRSGLKGKYLLITADMQAKRFIQQENFEAAGNAYKEAAESGILHTDELQLAWYLTAYSYLMSGTIDGSQIVLYLRNAINAQPDSPAVEKLAEMIKQVEGR